ncbi:hypothetical protein [Acidovorax facilis]|uniref:hypothetical protein n=1 Tax=Acidovorax facilis TaxID=12917 RepID=UPI003D648884
MTSPVDTSVKWARSSMPGAPTLTRAAGSLIALLDALLVNGWGQQTASSVVVAGGVATATFPTDHAAAKHAVVLVDGVTGTLTALNGEQKVTAVAPNVIKWATAAADGAATGTITVKMAPAGFAKPFTGTNLAAYKSAHPAAHGQYLRVADTTVESARAVGYETMTAISTGTGLFPSAAQVSGGAYWGKSDATSGTTPSPWLFASDGRIFYLMVQGCFESNAGLGHAVLAFGDLVPESPAGDPFATVLAGSPDSGWNAVGGNYVIDYGAVNYAVATPRVFLGTGTSSRGCASTESRFGASSDPLPNPITGAIPLSRIGYKDTVAGFQRATFPGLLYCINPKAEALIANHQVVELPGGKAYAASFHGNQVYVSSMLNVAMLDIIGPWR